MNSTDTILKIINEGMEKKDRYVTLFLMKMVQAYLYTHPIQK